MAFALEHPTDVNKLKEYKDIKKILKEEQIRFQTPYPAKMRIHWKNSACIYNNATDTTEDMRRRGYSLDLPRTPDINWAQQLT